MYYLCIYICMQCGIHRYPKRVLGSLEMALGKRIVNHNVDTGIQTRVFCKSCKIQKCSYILGHLSSAFVFPLKRPIVFMCMCVRATLKERVSDNIKSNTSFHSFLLTCPLNPDSTSYNPVLTPFPSWLISLAVDLSCTHCIHV